MHTKSEREPESVAQRSVIEFDLHSANPAWAIAADWILDRARDEADEIQSAAMRAGIWSPSPIYPDGDGNGSGDGIGSGDGNGSGDGIGSGNGNGSGNGSGYGNGSGNGSGYGDGDWDWNGDGDWDWNGDWDGNGSGDWDG